MSEMAWQLLPDAILQTLAEGVIIEAELGGKRIALLRRDDKLFAFAATCPHAGARFCEGWLDAQGRVVCPLHKYRFDPVNGRNTGGEGYKLRTYAVETREEGIFVALPVTS